MSHPLSIRLDEELEALYLARRVARRVEDGRERLVPIEDLTIRIGHRRDVYR